MQRITLSEAIKNAPRLSDSSVPQLLNEDIGVHIDASENPDKMGHIVLNYLQNYRDDVLGTILGQWIEKRGVVVVSHGANSHLRANLKKDYPEVIQQSARRNHEFWHVDNSVLDAQRFQSNCHSVLWCDDDPTDQVSGPETAFGETWEVMQFISDKVRTALEKNGEKPDLVESLRDMANNIQNGPVPKKVYRLMRHLKTPIDYITPAISAALFLESMHLPSTVSHAIQPGEAVFWSHQLVMHGRLPLKPGVEKVNTLIADDFYTNLPFKGV